MKLLIENAIVQAESAPVMVNGAPVHFARLLWLGGQIRCANPNKFNGQASAVEVEVSIQQSAKVGGGFAQKNPDGTKGPVGERFGALTQEIKFVSIIAAKMSK